MPTLLFECFSEEMPARMQAPAEAQLHERFEKALKDSRLEHGTVKTFVSPRHLGIRIEGLPAQQPDITIERKGPKVGAPEQAMQGFLKSTGLSVDELEQRDTGKGTFYFAVKEEQGKPTREALKPIIEQVMHEFSWPKSMRWGAYECSWVRPLHRLVALLDDQVIPAQFHHITASNITFGHRFLAPEAITLTHADDYEAALEKAYVQVDRATRQSRMMEQSEALLSQKKLALIEDRGLLDEVTGLVEWPHPKCGTIDETFMRLPKEVLVSEMREHQKYFATTESENHTSRESAATDAIHSHTQEWAAASACAKPELRFGEDRSANASSQNGISPHYLIIANVPGDAGAIEHGNNRVLRARLSDGAFYWDSDRAVPLSEWAEKLASVIFHAKLGTTAQKVQRIRDLSGHLALFVPHANLEHVARGAELCKADLVTGMVGEFPDLQGIMGQYYAQEQKEVDEVARGIYEHYLPQGAADGLPGSPVGITLAIADKLDTMVGMFGIGEAPTGSKDPFALRRSALGILRIIRQHGLRLSLSLIIDKAMKGFSAKTLSVSTDDLAAQLARFFIDRLKVALKEEGLRHDVIEAASRGDEELDVVRIVARAEALNAFLASSEGENLLAAYRRAGNIVAAEEKKDNAPISGAPNSALFEEEAEHNLHSALAAMDASVTTALAEERFDDAMSILASLRAPLDAFFEGVMVNSDDKELRMNRLCLLSQVRRNVNRVAAFDEIEGA